MDTAEEITLDLIAKHASAEWIENCLDARDKDVYYAAYSVSSDVFDVDPHEAAQALREEIVELNEQTSSGELADSYFAFHRGETGDWSLDSELPFGKYEGKTVGWLLDNDEDYADWIIEEMAASRTQLATFLAMKLDERRVEEFHARETPDDVVRDEITEGWADGALYRSGETFLSTAYSGELKRAHELQEA